MKTFHRVVVLGVAMAMLAAFTWNGSSSRQTSAESYTLTKATLLGGFMMPAGTVVWQPTATELRYILPDGVWLMNRTTAGTSLPRNSGFIKCDCEGGQGRVIAKAEPGWFACQGDPCASSVMMTTSYIGDLLRAQSQVVDTRLGVHFATREELKALSVQAPAGLLDTPGFREQLLKLLAPLENKEKISWDYLTLSFALMREDKAPTVRVPLNVYGWLVYMEMPEEWAQQHAKTLLYDPANRSTWAQEPLEANDEALLFGGIAPANPS